MMDTLVRFATIQPLSDLEFEGVAATGGRKDDGYDLDISGGDISRFADGKAPLLLQHDPDRIVGTSSLRKSGNALILRGRFATPGVSPVADQARRLLKDSILNSLSLGFAVREKKPIAGGFRATKWEALECSLVAVGMDPKAVVTQRAALSRLLARSGRRLSAATQESLRAALDQHLAGMAAHRNALRCSREMANILQALLDDDETGDAERSADRRRRQRHLEVLALRWRGSGLEERAKRLDDLEKLRRRGRQLGIR